MESEEEKNAAYATVEFVNATKRKEPSSPSEAAEASRAPPKPPRLAALDSLSRRVRPHTDSLSSKKTRLSGAAATAAAMNPLGALTATLAQRGVRLAILAFCLALFLWQACAIIAEYRDREVATKVNILPVTANLSHFDVAFCMEPTHALRKLHYKGNGPPLDVNHLSTIKALTDKYKGKIYADKFEKLLKDLVHDVDSRINFVFDDDTNANIAHSVSRPFYHPLYGACATVDLDDREGIVTSLVIDIAPRESLFKNVRLDKKKRKRRRKRQAEHEHEEKESEESPPLGSVSEEYLRLRLQLLAEYRQKKLEEEAEAEGSDFPGTKEQRQRELEKAEEEMLDKLARTADLDFLRLRLRLHEQFKRRQRKREEERRKQLLQEQQENATAATTGEQDQEDDDSTAGSEEDLGVQPRGSPTTAAPIEQDETDLPTLFRPLTTSADVVLASTTSTATRRPTPNVRSTTAGPLRPSTGDVGGSPTPTTETSTVSRPLSTPPPPGGDQGPRDVLSNGIRVQELLPESAIFLSSSAEDLPGLTLEDMDILEEILEEMLLEELGSTAGVDEAPVKEVYEEPDFVDYEDAEEDDEDEEDLILEESLDDSRDGDKVRELIDLAEELEPASVSSVRPTRQDASGSDGEEDTLREDAETTLGFRPTPRSDIAPKDLIEEEIVEEGIVTTSTTTEDPRFLTNFYRERVVDLPLASSGQTSVLRPVLTLLRERDSPLARGRRPFLPTPSSGSGGSRATMRQPKQVKEEGEGHRLSAAGNAGRKAKRLKSESGIHRGNGGRNKGGDGEKFIAVPANVDDDYLKLQKQLLGEFREKKRREHVQHLLAQPHHSGRGPAAGKQRVPAGLLLQRPVYDPSSEGKEHDSQHRGRTLYRTAVLAGLRFGHTGSAGIAALSRGKHRPEESFVPVPAGVDDEYVRLQEQLLKEFQEKKHPHHVAPPRHPHHKKHPNDGAEYEDPLSPLELRDLISKGKQPTNKNRPKYEGSLRPHELRDLISGGGGGGHFKRSPDPKDLEDLIGEGTKRQITVDELEKKRFNQDRRQTNVKVDKKKGEDDSKKPEGKEKVGQKRRKENPPPPPPNVSEDFLKLQHQLLDDFDKKKPDDNTKKKEKRADDTEVDRHPKQLRGFSGGDDALPPEVEEELEQLRRILLDEYRSKLLQNNRDRNKRITDKTGTLYVDKSDGKLSFVLPIPKLPSFLNKDKNKPHRGHQQQQQQHGDGQYTFSPGNNDSKKSKDSYHKQKQHVLHVQKQQEQQRNKNYGPQNRPPADEDHHMHHNFRHRPHAPSSSEHYYQEEPDSEVPPNASDEFHKLRQQLLNEYYAKQHTKHLEGGGGDPDNDDGRPRQDPRVQRDHIIRDVEEGSLVVSPTEIPLAKPIIRPPGYKYGSRPVLTGDDEEEDDAVGVERERLSPRVRQSTLYRSQFRRDRPRPGQYAAQGGADDKRQWTREELSVLLEDFLDSRGGEGGGGGERQPEAAVDAFLAGMRRKIRQTYRTEGSALGDGIHGLHGADSDGGGGAVLSALLGSNLAPPPASAPAPASSSDSRPYRFADGNSLGSGGRGETSELAVTASTSGSDGEYCSPFSYSYGEEICCRLRSASNFTCCTPVGDGGGGDDSACCCTKSEPRLPCDCNTVYTDGGSGVVGGGHPQLSQQFRRAPPLASALTSSSSIENEVSLSTHPSLLRERVVIFLYEPGQFHLTHAGVAVAQGRVELVEIQQDLINKTDVRHCLSEDCDPSSYLDEDSCLNSCLVDKFIAETGCVHPRLKLLLRRHGEHTDSRGAIRVCDYHDLSNLLTKNVLPRRTDAGGNEIEPGISLIKKILSGFTKGAKERCGCPKPCVRRHFDVKRWKDFAHTNAKDMEAVINVNQRYLLYQDGATFDFVKMMADLGGYFGLLLGFSVYSLADLVDFLWKRRKRAKAREFDPNPS